MVTRTKVGTFKKNPKFAYHVSVSSSIPCSHIHALRDPNWKHAMLDEYNALISNDGSLSRYKARLVANGRSQQQGINYDETFSPVVKPATIRTVLSLAASRNDFAYLLIYVDGIILTASSSDILKQIISLLHAEFFMVDLDPLNYFLRISVRRTSSSLFLSQTKYACEVLERAGMLNCKTPADT
uniref:Reverse transcriptase Ty1/copia-type domain-containing protein n=1 Tax=Tanacetum cinerariifolium TaxID=118510 RepID=A0A6L2KG27_TANCI|nr:hypothetical protein [Tanacetum cinerariifolium]